MRVVGLLGVVWWYVIAITVGILQALSIVFPQDFFYISIFGHCSIILLLVFEVNLLKDIWLLISIIFVVCVSTLITLNSKGIFLSLPQIGGDKIVIVSPQKLLFQSTSTESWVSDVYIHNKAVDTDKSIKSQPFSILLTLRKEGNGEKSFKNCLLKVDKGDFSHLKIQNKKLSGFDMYKLSKGLIISLRAYKIQFIGKDKIGFLTKRIDSINEKLGDLRWGHREDTNAFFKSVLWADKQALPKKTKKLFKELGLSHLLIVSGFHVGLVFLVLKAFFFIFKPLVRWQLTFSFMQVFVLCYYAFAICGGSPSVTRAVIMASIAIIAFALDRDVNGYHLLGVATVLILILCPLWLLDMGFLLSFVAVLGILIALELSKMYVISSNKIFKIAWSNIVVTVGAQLFTLPIVLSSFGEWYSIGLLSSVLLGIIFSILIGLGLLTIPFLAIESVQDWLYTIMDFCFSHILAVCKWLHSIVFLDIRGHIEAWQALVLFFVLALVYILKKKPKLLAMSLCSYFIAIVLFILF